MNSSMHVMRNIFSHYAFVAPTSELYADTPIYPICSDEDDALLSTLNAESAVTKIGIY